MNSNLHAMALEPLISVIMPCFNNSATIERSVKSALDQSHENIEVILVDDGSTDNSREIALELRDKDARLKIITQPNQGPGPARNRGLKEARGEFVAFLDADDYWHADCLYKLHEALVGNDAELAYCGWQNIGKDGKGGDPFIPPDYAGIEKVVLLLGGCRWPIHAALTKKNAIFEVGGFDERWTSCMDYDLWLRMASTRNIVRVPEVLAYYVHHEGEQITKNRLRGAVNHWRIQLEFIRNHGELINGIGKKRIRELTYGELLRRAYISYWGRDLDVAQRLFRLVMKGGYGGIRDWKYMLPALLPGKWYRKLVTRADHVPASKP
jgi:glycosyltransferase involved in cell wall biosynthesis